MNKISPKIKIIIIILLLICIFSIFYKNQNYTEKYFDENGTKKYNVLTLDQWNRLKNFQNKKKLSNLKCCVVSGDDRINDEILLLKNINKKYCLKNNYDFIFFDKKMIKDLDFENKYSPYWWKVALILKIMMESDYDYIMWLDSDACFNDHNFKLENLCSVDKNIIFYMCSDNIEWHSPFNAGVWIIKNDSRGKEFMLEWLNMYNSSKWTKNKGKWSCKNLFFSCRWAGDEYEQGACCKLINKEKYAPYVLNLPWQAFQHMHEPSKYSYVMHFADINKKHIKNYVKKYFKN